MLDEPQLRTRLVDTGLFARVVRVASTTSTNAQLAEAARAADFAEQWPHMSVLTAEEQTAGVGRLGRNWQSPQQTMLASSIVLRPTLPAGQWHWLTLAAGLGLVTALKARGVPAQLKWPNDVHIQGRKIAGILAVIPPEDSSAVILGCGINVLQAPEQLPTATATSLLLETAGSHPGRSRTGEGPDSELRTQLLAEWLEEFAHLMAQIQAQGDIAGLRSRIIGAISTTGQQVRVELPSGNAVRGRALGVDDDGGLQVEVTARRRAVLDPEAGGGDQQLWESTAARRETFSAGDVVHLRPTEP